MEHIHDRPERRAVSKILLPGHRPGHGSGAVQPDAPASDECVQPAHQRGAAVPKERSAERNGHHRLHY